MATTYIPLYTTTLASAATSVTISPISGAYTDLVLVCGNLKYVTGDDDGYVRFNGDTGNNYSWTQLNGSSSTPTSNRNSNTFGIRSINGMGTSSPGTTIINIQNYNNSTTFKTTISRHSTNFAGAFVGLWRNTAAITSLTVVNVGAGGFAAGSTFSLYGVTAANVGAKATGGVISSDANYWYHTFTSSGTFTPLQSLTCDYLVIAGGGGGGATYGAGGGAGGYLTTVGLQGGGAAAASALSLTATAYTVTIGAGGAAGVQGTNNGSASNGSNSVFSSITATGGGGGAGNGNASAQNAGGDGGSSGGGTYASGAAGTPTVSPVQGYSGGAGPGGFFGGGGGGGAGSAGVLGAAAELCVGGNGLTSSIGGFAVTRAGGGGGYISAGGSGGGGEGGGVGSPGEAFTGSGGGASTINQLAGAGGSGLVIVRYPI